MDISMDISQFSKIFSGKINLIGHGQKALMCVSNDIELILNILQKKKCKYPKAIDNVQL